MSKRQTPVFTYGTLRPGCGNDRMLGAYRHLGPATAAGRLHYHECYLYPVYRPYDMEWDESVVHGDLLLADDNLVRDVMAMEVYAGYNAEWADVKVHAWPDDPKRYEIVEALTFPWRRDHYGERIDSGDWTTTPGGWAQPRLENA